MSDGGTTMASGGTMATGGADASGPTFAYVGSGDFGGEPGKVSLYKLDRQAATLEFVEEYPAGGLASFMAFDIERHRVFVADEKNGGVLSFSADPATGKLTSLGATASPNHPVNLALSSDGQFLLGANYNEGSVDVYPIGSDGKAQTSTASVATGSHAHCVVFAGAGGVLVSNEGSDTISHFSFSGGTLMPLTPPTSSSFSPRHITVGSNGTVYVVSERGDHITAYEQQSSGALQQLWQEKRLDTGAPTQNTGADIHLTPDGKFLYASNRGSSNTLVAFALSASGAELLGHVPSEGVTPRNFSMDPAGQLLLVGNHGSQKTLALFAIGTDGKLTKKTVQDTSFSPYFVHLVSY